jgi:excisionase family DNA binding protein
MRTYSIKRAAKLIGVHRMTLYHWVVEGKFRPSIVVRMDGRTLRRFTDADVIKGRRFKARQKRGRKKKKRKA